MADQQDDAANAAKNSASAKKPAKDTQNKKLRAANKRFQEAGPSLSMPRNTLVPDGIQTIDLLRSLPKDPFTYEPDMFRQTYENLIEASNPDKAITNKHRPNSPCISEDKEQRKRVFICFSYEDQNSLEELHTHLEYHRREKLLDIWDSTTIRPGEEWHEEILKALEATKIAVLLVSANFFASNFIAENELPLLLEAKGRGEIILLPVILSHSAAFDNSSLAQFQAINPPDKPLADLTKAQRNQVWVKLVRHILSIV